MKISARHDPRFFRWGDSAMSTALARPTQTQDLHRVYTGVPEGSRHGQTPDLNLGTIRNPWFESLYGCMPDERCLAFLPRRRRRIVDSTRTQQTSVMSIIPPRVSSTFPPLAPVVIGGARGVWRATRRRVAGSAPRGSIDKLVTPMRDGHNILGRQQVVSFFPRPPCMNLANCC
jgi:hypothetical protein